MKSITIYQLPITIVATIVALCFTACEPNKPEEPKAEVIPSAFVQKHLIEEFTGQACGYCPYGMDCIHDFMATDTNWVLVLHHYGYKQDNFTVAGSKTITSALKVSGAPSVSINRANVNYGGGKGIVFSPGYLSYTSKKQFSDSTYASINIANSYDASSRQLTVKVSGLVARNDIASLQLTVLVKESGMVDYQADYYKTYEGWQEFRHANAVRAFLTEAKGDEVDITNQHYSAEYTVNLNSKWVAENCMVVAFLSEAFKPVIQAEQKPVVAGTQGGADILHGGITPVPVPDYYPEPDATSGPADFSQKETQTLTVADARYQQSTNYTIWQIQTYNVNDVTTIKKVDCVPFAFLYLFTEPNTTTIPTGTYPLEVTGRPGTALAGYRDDANVTIDGSTFYFTELSYLQEGYLNPYAQWMIADGELTVTETGWSLTGHALNGSDIKLVGTTAIVNRGKLSIPAKMSQRAGMICK